jgi:hypothetical protein
MHAKIGLLTLVAPGLSQKCLLLVFIPGAEIPHCPLV